ncbi:MAG: hypothetical protein HFG66_11705 [Hungatella sp.]|nr:hypothetical protein [Hungatella sp.]
MNEQAVVITSFGTSVPEAQISITLVEEALTAVAKDWICVRVFTSPMIRRILRERGVDIPSLTEALERLLAAGNAFLTLQIIFSGRGIQAALWQHGYPTPRKWRGNPRGRHPLLAHDFRRKSSVLYLLSRLVRERGGAVWRSHFHAPENQAAGWSGSNHPTA